MLNDFSQGLVSKEVKSKKFKLSKIIITSIEILVKIIQLEKKTYLGQEMVYTKKYVSRVNKFINSTLFFRA